LKNYLMILLAVLIMPLSACQSDTLIEEEADIMAEIAEELSATDPTPKPTPTPKPSPRPAPTIEPDEVLDDDDVEDPEETASKGTVSTPEPTPKPEAPADPPAATGGRTYDMNDPNVKKYPIYTTATTAAEFKAGSVGFQSAAEIVKMMKDQAIYDLNFGPGETWLNNYMSTHGLSWSGKSDYNKTAVIKHIVDNGALIDVIRIWDPGFNWAGNDCAPIANAIYSLMGLMDFKLFKTVSCSVNGVAHSTNAYWDDSEKAIRFVDGSGWGVWNHFVDEINSKGFLLADHW